MKRVVVEESVVSDPVIGPSGAALSDRQGTTPRLTRHQFTLSDGHPVGLSVAGSGIPLVVIHGFSAEGFLYAQTLSRLVSMGFKVIAIDTAGHGGTAGLPADGANIVAYASLLVQILEELGIEQCVLAGHSMGGRLVAQVAATHPEKVIAAMLIDAIVGDTWDQMVYLFRVWPPLLGAVGAMLLVDSATIVPVFNDPKQAIKLGRLLVPTVLGHVVKPWRMLGPMVSILRTRSSRYALDAAHRSGVPFFVLHGDRDFAVPMRTAEDTARRVAAPLVKIAGAGHSWLLRDPETLPAIVRELRSAGFGEAIADAIAAAGLDPNTATSAEIERAFLAADAPLLDMADTGPIDEASAADRDVHDADVTLHQPIYEWTILAPESDEESVAHPNLRLVSGDGDIEAVAS